MPHQANLRIIEYARRKAKMDPDEGDDHHRPLRQHDRRDDSVVASRVAQEEGRLKKGDLVMTSTFGAGFTWGAMALRWQIGS